MTEPELLTTGEAVVLEITLTTVANRIISGFVDYVVYALGVGLSAVMVMVLVISVGSEFRENLALTRMILPLAPLAWMVVIPLLVESPSGGRSLGRTVTGTRMVRDDGGTAGLRHCLVRTPLAVVEIWGTWVVPALCASIVSKWGKRFGGMLADTYVVREHHRSHMALPLLMPPELARWVASTDLCALPGSLSLMARTFLQRASSLVPPSCHQLGLELAPQVQGYVPPPSLVGTHSERLPVVVLTERRNRELVLESRGRQLGEDVLWDMARPSYEVGGETRRC